MRTVRFFSLMSLIGSLTIAAVTAIAQETKPAVPVATDKESKAEGEPLPREQRIANYLTGAKFVGSYTIDSKGLNDAKEETYTISKAEKLPHSNATRRV